MDPLGDVEHPAQHQPESCGENTATPALKVEEIQRHLARLETSRSRVDDSIRTINDRLDRMETRNELVLNDVGEIKVLLAQLLQRPATHVDIPGQAQGAANNQVWESEDATDSNNDTIANAESESDASTPGVVAREGEYTTTVSGQQPASRRPPTIKHSELKELRIIGQGNFGTVFRGRHVTLGDIAYKQFDSCVNQPDSRVARRAKHEVDSHILRHVNIVMTLAMVSEAGQCGIVFEYVKFGNLEKFLEHHLSIGWHVLLSFARDIACGLHQLHGLTPPAVHGDMKIQNVLIGEGFVAKISDFGLSKWAVRSTMYSTATRPLSETTTHVPPERWININASRTPKCDVYGYALLLWEMFSRSKPFAECRNNDEICVAVTGGRRPSIDAIRGDTEPRMPEQMFQLTKQNIIQCWSREPSERPNMKEVGEKFDKFLKEHIGDVISEKKELDSVVGAAAAGPT